MAEMTLVRTIREAYPFDENNRKNVTKKKIASKEAGDWGKVSVYKLGPMQINCDMCGQFILDRQGTEPFYYCRRCRSRGRKLELCVNCFQDFHRKPTEMTEGTNSSSPPATPMGAARSDAGSASGSPTNGYSSPKGGGSPKSPKGAKMSMSSVGSEREPLSPTTSPSGKPTFSARGQRMKSTPTTQNYMAPEPSVPRTPSSSRGIPLGPTATTKSSMGSALTNAKSGHISMGPALTNAKSGHISIGTAPSERNPVWSKTVAQRLSGAWSGTIHEGGSPRHVKYELKFLPDGTLSGSAAGFVFLSGTFSCSDGQHGNFEWVEKHEWGTSNITGTFMARPSNAGRLKGSFVMSDGGKGTFELSCNKISSS